MNLRDRTCGFKKRTVESWLWESGSVLRFDVRPLFQLEARKVLDVLFLQASAGKNLWSIYQGPWMARYF